MLEFVAAYTKPDGLVPLVGDADDGRVQKLGHAGAEGPSVPAVDRRGVVRRADFKRAAGRFCEETFWLLGPGAATAFDALPCDGAGASRWHSPMAASTCCVRGAHVVVDCGEVGMHGRGGHGHNDILGFELWLDGMNVVTDCGAYLYTASREWRNRFRSTAFHNIVQVDDEELNRFLVPDNCGSFRTMRVRAMSCGARRRSIIFGARTRGICA